MTLNPLEGLYLPAGVGLPEIPQEELEEAAGDREVWASLWFREWVDGLKEKYSVFIFLNDNS